MNDDDKSNLGWDRQYVTRQEYLNIMNEREKLYLEENRKVFEYFDEKLLGITWVSLNEKC